MSELSGHPGFAPPRATRLMVRRVAALELAATLALTVSLIVAATAVSVGNKALKNSADGSRSAAAPTLAVDDGDTLP